jgi:hypothetical protein
VEKDDGEFWKGRQCKDCRRKYQREYQQKPENRERQREYQREYYQTIEGKERKREREREYRQNPEYRERHREYQLSKYGLTLDGWNDVIRNQNDKCACCGVEMDDRSKNTKNAARPDHCHITNQFRAAICSACNWAEGHIRDRDHLLSLARYIFGEDLRQQLLFGKS